jgi:hypothetical protein
VLSTKPPQRLPCRSPKVRRTLFDVPAWSAANTDALPRARQGATG